MTDGRCVPHQIAAATTNALKLDEMDVDFLFEEIFEELYPEGGVDNPYEIESETGEVERRTRQDAGVTLAMIERFCKRHQISVHALWGDHKILRFVPDTPKTSICLYVWGDHAFFVGCPQTKSAIAQMALSAPVPRPEVILKTVYKPDGPPASEWVAWTGDVAAKGHYRTHYLLQTRAALHSKGIRPRVKLDGRGAIKNIHVHGAVIHRLTS